MALICVVGDGTIRTIYKQPSYTGPSSFNTTSPPPNTDQLWVFLRGFRGQDVGDDGHVVRDLAEQMLRVLEQMGEDQLSHAMIKNRVRAEVWEPVCAALFHQLLDFLRKSRVEDNDIDIEDPSHDHATTDSSRPPGLILHTGANKCS